MTKKSTPKQIADEMETEQNYPVLNKYNKIAKAVDRMDEGPGKQVARGAVLAGTVPAGVAQIGHSLITGKRGRSKEDTDELEREIGRGQRAEKKAKGGDVQSESSKLDQKNEAMDKAQNEGYKRYQAEQAKEAKANAESRNVGSRLKATALKAANAVMGPIENKVHDVNEYLDKKSEGVLSKKQREAVFGNPREDRAASDKANKEMTKDSYKKGGKVSASSRGDGIAQRGKTKGRMV